ncbi:MAG: class I SAM-dependent methyltransferase [Anaerolineae bacterium]
MEIVDLGGRRVVEIRGKHWGPGGFVEHSRFETPYSRETIEAILEVKGITYLRDEIDRAENSERIVRPLRDLIERFTTLEDKHLLDFGAGCGGSSLILARLGARVTSVEPVASYVRVAQLRARDAGLAPRVTALHVPDTRRLPFEPATFDLAMANGVLEHIPPALRGACLGEMWRVLKPGGLLFVYETPNRLWPVDHHTTGLPLIPYLPPGLAFRLARARSDRVEPHETWEDLVDRGVIGVTYWEIARAFPRGEATCMNLLDGQDVPRFLDLSMRNVRSRARRWIKSFLYRALDRLVCRPFRIPAAAFFPLLSLCFRKGAGP